MNEYLIMLTSTDLQTINAGLQELPMKIAAPLIMRINAQLQELEKAETVPECLPKS